MEYNARKQIYNLSLRPTYYLGQEIGGFVNSDQTFQDGSKAFVLDGRLISSLTATATQKDFLTGIFGTNLPNYDGCVSGQPSISHPFSTIPIGEDKHILTILEIPSHNHRYTSVYGADVCGSAGKSLLSTTEGTTENTGGDLSHNNIQRTIFAEYRLIFAGI